MIYNFENKDAMEEAIGQVTTIGGFMYQYENLRMFVGDIFAVNYEAAVQMNPDRTNRRTTGPSQITGLGMGHVLETADGGERKFSLTRLKWLARQAKAQETPVPDRNPEVSETVGADYVWLDWMAGYPKRKYRIHRDGRVWNAVDERWEEGENILISAGDVSSRARGTGRSPHTHIKRGALVYRAFFKQTRSIKRLCVKFRDGNRGNCALTNLYYTGSAGGQQ